MFFTLPFAEGDLPALLAALARRPGFFVLGDPAGTVGRDNRWIHFGAEPRETLTTKGRRLVWQRAGESPRGFEGSPTDALAGWLDERHVAREGPRPFLSGWVGYLGHDLAWHTEPHLGAHLAAPRAPDLLNQPDLHLALHDTVWAWDRAELVLSVFIDDELCADVAARREECERLVTQLSSFAPGEHTLGTARATSSVSRAEHAAAVARIQEYIRAGDVYQVNLTHRFTCPFAGDPLGLWWALARRHPMPWSALLALPDAHLVGNSPECLLTIEGDRLTTRPIKGTAPRGATASEDAAQARALTASEKDRAEHLMIVDLERNDLGRVAVAGSVAVEEFAALATHPTLHHLVSTVTATRRPGVTTATTLRAMLPGGSVTGAPKARAIEIIDEVEASRRGPFYSAVGWLDRSGDVALGLAIRTALVQGGRLELAVGGAIVADSVAELEWAEARLKASAFLGLEEAT